MFVCLLTVIINYRSSGGSSSVASKHGRVLALAACVLSVPYDMPRYITAFLFLFKVVISDTSYQKCD